MKLIKRLITLLCAVIVFVIAAVFVTDNPETIDISFYHWQLEQISLPLFVIVVLSIGLLIGFLARSMRLMALRSRIALLQRQLNSVEKERDKLKLSSADK